MESRLDRKYRNVDRIQSPRCLCCYCRCNPVAHQSGYLDHHCLIAHPLGVVKIKWKLRQSQNYLTIRAIVPFIIWKKQKSVRGNFPRRENPIAIQAYFLLKPFLIANETVEKSQSIDQESVTFPNGSKIFWWTSSAEMPENIFLLQSLNFKLIWTLCEGFLSLPYKPFTKHAIKQIAKRFILFTKTVFIAHS